MRHHWRFIFMLAFALGMWLLGAPDLSAQGVAPGGAPGQRVQDSYGGSLMGEAVIQYDVETGSLIIITDEETNKHIERIVESLDKPVPQVLIKVLFLEVTHTDDFDLGVEGTFKYGSGENTDIISTLFGLADQTRGGFYHILETDLEITIRAIAEKSKTEVLSRPSILARNNQEATITIGKEVPFVRNSRVTSDGQIINTIEYEDIGIILSVTPHITPEGLVELDVIPEISTLTGETVQVSDTVNATIIAKRSAKTRVVVADGKTVVIGGLMEDNDTEAVSKIPLLGDIPILGMAFRRTTKTKSKTELLIFLTPHVVESPSELQAVSALEKNNTELVPDVFSDNQMNKYIGSFQN